MPDDDGPEASSLAVVSKPFAHDSARLHVTGAATYVDDVREPAGTLHIAPGLAEAARGRLLKLDLDPVRRAPGVVCALTAADIPGRNDISPSAGDEPMFATRDIIFHGQMLFAVVAATRDAARRAARLRVVEIEREDANPHHRGRDRRRGRVQPDYAVRPRRCRGGAGGLSAPSRRAPVDRRPGALLPRGPGRARDPRRGRPDDGDLLDAGSGRGAAYRGPRAGRARRDGDGGDAPSGRRLRRQGEPGLRLGGDRGARQPASPAVRASCGSTATTISR